jgi:hypothetical protein
MRRKFAGMTNVSTAAEGRSSEKKSGAKKKKKTTTLLTQLHWAEKCGQPKVGTDAEFQAVAVHGTDRAEHR